MKVKHNIFQTKKKEERRSRSSLLPSTSCPKEENASLRFSSFVSLERPV